MKPWEKYKSASSESGGPWQKYGSKEASEAKEPYEYSGTIQEQHPNVTTGMRATLKNFANSPESGMAYLKQELPDHDVDFYNGQYRVKRKDDKDWRVVDPDTGFFSKDILNDALDVAYDVGAGTAEGVATGLGAAKGALLSVPLLGTGAIPGAMLAGGATSAGLEAIRQKLGQALGIPQEVDTTDVVTSGVIGGVTPGLTGAGPAKGLVRGAYDFTRDKAAPKIASWASGKGDDAINYLKENFPKIVEMEKDSGLGYTRQVHQRLRDWLESSRDAAGKRIGEVYKNTTEPVDISNVKNILQQTKEEILTSSPDNVATKAEIEGIEELQGLVATLPDQLPAEQAFNLKQQINAYAKPHELSKGITDSQPVTRKFDAKRLVGTGRRAGGALNESLERAAGPELKAANEEFGKQAAIEGYLGSKFRDVDQTYNTLVNLDNRSRRMLGANLNEIAEEGGIDLADDALALKTLDQFARPGLTPIGGGSSKTSIRSIPLAAAGGLVGGYTGNHIGLTGQPGVDSGIGALVGLGLGGMFGSPQMIRRGIRALLATEGGVNWGKDKISKMATRLGVPESEVAREAAQLGLTTEGMKSAWEGMTTPNYLRPNP